MATTRRERSRKSGRPAAGTLRRTKEPATTRRPRGGGQTGTVRRPRAGGERPTRGAGSRRRSASGSKTKRVPLIVGIALTLVLGLAGAFFAKTRDSGDVKGQMHAIVADFAGYQRDRAYYSGLVERAHVQVFDSHYQMRRRRNDFNPADYYRDMVVTMVTLAAGDGREDVAAAIAAEHME